ncbi:MAG TPA: pyridoxal phosphate-dependent aminotransferase, partial [Bacteroidales bacterium]|nr:pyridoxal phosphate-dependent aminotransferase [Bacteroidales bacterium]
MMELQFAERISRLEPYALASRWQQVQRNNLSGHEVLNLSIGNPEEGPDLNVLNSLSETVTIKNRHGYQAYQGTSLLIESWRHWLDNHLNLQLNSRQMMITQGAREAIHLVSMTLLNPGDIVLGPDPGYPLYKTIAELYGAEYIPYNLQEERHWQPDIEQLKNLDAKRVKLMWLNSPH